MWEQNKKKEKKHHSQQAENKNLDHWMDMAFKVVQQFKLNLTWNLFQNNGNKRYFIPKPYN